MCQSQRSCILTLPRFCTFRSSTQHLSCFNSAAPHTCTPAGLGRYTEAEPLLRNAHRVLHESFSGAFEAVGEAKFYLSLLALVGARSEEQVKALDTSLMQVRAVTWVMGGLVGSWEHADAGRPKPLSFRARNPLYAAALICWAAAGLGACLCRCAEFCMSLLLLKGMQLAEQCMALDTCLTQVQQRADATLARQHGVQAHCSRNILPGQLAS